MSNRKRWQIAAACGVVLLAVGATATLSYSSESEIRRWSGQELLVYNQSPHKQEVQIAIQQWNLARVGIRLRLVGKEHAQVLIRQGDGSQCVQKNRCVGYASAKGYTGQQSTIWIHSPLAHPGSEEDYDNIRVLIHELGHVLGLPHTEQCGIMSRDAVDACGALTVYHPHICGPDRHAVDILRKMYGGSGPIRQSQRCTSMDQAIRSGR